MIGFDLTDEQRMIRETVMAFAAEEIRPAARACRRKRRRFLPN